MRRLKNAEVVAIEGPERTLLAAMLVRAFLDLSKPKHKRSAIAWFRGDKKSMISFAEVCECLELDREAVFRFAVEVGNEKKKFEHPSFMLGFGG